MTYHKIKLTIKLLVLSYTIFFILPLTLAYFTHGLSKEEIVERLPQPFKETYHQNQIRILELQNAINSTQATLIKGTDNAADKITKIKYLQEEIERREKLYRVAGMSYNRLSYIYPLSIFLLSFVYFVLLENKNIYSVKDQLKILIPTYLFQSSFTWYRNSPFGQAGRTVYSVYNSDINPYLFIFQEICVFTFFALCIMICHKVFSELKDLKKSEKNGYSYSNAVEIITKTRKSYHQWQLLSIILFGVFGFYVYHFWMAVYDVHDRRYLFAAFSFNLFWGIIWYICSIPTFRRLDLWNKYKFEILSNTKDANGRNLLEQYVLEKDIVSGTNQSISTFLMILSFLIPLIKAMSE